MQWTRAFLLERVMARDKTFDGRVITGVLSTGIYCLPSCGARNPKAENIRFFITEDEARAAGLRPCRRCRPDDYYRDYDPDQALIEELAARARHRPERFASVKSLAEAAGIGTVKLNTLFRKHFHLTPAEFLRRARIASAATLLEERYTPLNAALEVGYPHASTFHDHFKKQIGLTPGAYRELGGASAFELHLPADFLTEQTLAYLGRDSKAPDLRVRGKELLFAIPGEEGPRVIRMSLKAGLARVAPAGKAPLPPGGAYLLRCRVARMLGLNGDPAGFEARAAHEPRIARLIEGRRGLRIPQTADVFEGLVWAIIGQQVNLAFAYRLRGRLMELAGESGEHDLICHPGPERVARLEEADLTQRQFSRSKAGYLIGLARAVVGKKLDLGPLRQQSADHVAKTLMAMHGIGEWSARYVMMRSLGFGDCVPLGDAGLVNALRAFHGLEQRPDRARTERLMLPFAPHRALATHHLWQTLASARPTNV